MRPRYAQLLRSRIPLLVLLSVFLPIAHARAQAPPAAPTLGAVIERMGEYVAAYGEKSALIVAREVYSQQVTSDTRSSKTRKLTADFAIVKAGGNAGWIGFRDVIEVDGQRIVDRQDRLLTLLSDPQADTDAATRICDESARFNVGPVSRNFNVPTTVLFFFHPARLPRFQFTKKGTTTIDGVATWEIEFKEVGRPTLIMTRRGEDVPAEGAVWVVPSEGTIVRTQVRLKGFANAQAMRTLAGKTELVRVDSRADIEVDYRRDAGTGLWLPSRMSERYEGPMGWTREAAPIGTTGNVTFANAVTPVAGSATTVATYSDFRQFQTSAKYVGPK